MNIINYNNIDINDYKYIFHNNKYNLKCEIQCNNIDNQKTIICKTPKVILESNLKSGFLVISFNNSSKSLNFINFIKKIEKEATTYIKKNLKKHKLKLNSSFIEDNLYKKYIIKLNNNIKFFNSHNNLINNNEVEIYSNIISLFKLNNIWIDFEKNSFGLNWIILQIKVYPNLSYDKCIIYDSDDDNDNNYIIEKKEIIVQKCIFCNSICTFNNTINNISIAKGKGAIKGKGKGNNISNNTDNTNSGRGFIKSVSNNKEKKNNNKKSSSTTPILPPTVNDLVNMKNKLKKMVKIHSDSD